MELRDTCVQIYEVALYLEVEPTVAELKRLRDAGFFAQVAGNCRCFPAECCKSILPHGNIKVAWC